MCNNYLQILGMYTVDFQKRGLLHVHILLWLSDSNKLENAKHIDEVIFAEFPHPDLYPKLSNGVKTYMIHGLCGAARFNSPCINNVLNFFLKYLDIKLQLMKMDILYIGIKMTVYLC